MKSWLTVFYLIAIIHLGHAQELYSVNGKILSTEDQSSIVGATIVFSSVKDSTDFRFAISDIDGNFMVQSLESGFYKMTIKSVGFTTFRKILRVATNLNLGEIPLDISLTELESIEVRGQTIGVIIKGDTTQFLANAFKTNPDANAEDLLAKMPGIIVDQDGVQAQGEKVQRVLVDGKEFFGNDPNIALKTIPAEVIAKIEVFDQLSEQSQFTGFDDGNTTKTINIITKPEAKNGSFGRVYAGLGINEEYNAGGNLNIFNDDQRITILGLANNVNIQNFSSEDLVGVSSGTSGGRGGGGRGGRGGRRGPTTGSDPSDFLVGQQNGISSILSSGINYSDEIGEKIKLSGSYFFNQSNNDNQELISQTYFISDESDQHYDEQLNTSTDNMNHRVNIRAEYQINEKNSFILTPSLSFQQNESTSDFLGRFQSEDLTPISQTINGSSTDGNGYNFSNNLVIRHRFEKLGRTISLGIRSNINNKASSSLQDALTSYQINIARNDTIDQEVISDVKSTSWSSNLAYTEMLGKAMILQLRHSAGIKYNTADRRTNDLMTSSLDTALSSVFESNYLTQLTSASLMYRKSDWMFRAGLSYEYADLSADNVFPTDSRLSRKFQNILPMAMMRYEFSESKNLRLFYRTNTQEPSVNDLQEVINNNNPLFLSIGNSSLKQSYTHSLTSRYSSTNTTTGTSFFALFLLSKTDRYVANSTFFATSDTTILENISLTNGAQLSRPVNVNGFFNSRVFLTYGLPIGLLSSSLNLNTTITYNRIPGLINGQRNTSNNTNLGQGIVLASNISENIDFTLSYDGNYAIVKNSLQPEFNDNYYYQRIQAKTSFIFPGGIVLRSTLSHQKYAGLSGGFNQQFSLWNASIGKKILKDQKGEINLSVFDILGENTAITRTVTETYLEDSESQVLTTYFMINFTYNIRKYD